MRQWNLFKRLEEEIGGGIGRRLPHVMPYKLDALSPFLPTSTAGPFSVLFHTHILGRLEHVYKGFYSPVSLADGL